MDWLTQPESWIAFATLVVLELVLGVDNVIFISILAGKLPTAQQPRARSLGLGLAVLTRIILLFSISWVIGLTEPLFTVVGQKISGRDLILILGGLFLLWKSTGEIHQLLEGEAGSRSSVVVATFSGIIMQIIIIDLVFSLDSIITAVGMVSEVAIMIAAVVISVVLMMVFATTIGNFVSAHPTIKMLALAFLLVVGVALIADGLGTHVPRGYIYFAMAFSVSVELLNLRLRKRAAAPVELHKAYTAEALPGTGAPPKDAGRTRR